jgi:hypothetical protein
MRKKIFARRARGAGFYGIRVDRLAVAAGAYGWFTVISGM